MFFKDIDTWTDSKLKTNYIIYSIIYYVCTLLAPIIVIGVKYGIFNNAVKEKALNGFLIILILIVLLAGLRAFKKQVLKMNEDTYKDMRIKYSLLGLYALSIPAIIIFLLIISRNQMELAYNTALYCLLFYALGIVIDYTSIKYIENAKKLRGEVDHDERKEKVAYMRATKANK